MAAHSSILAWRIPMDRGAWRTTSAVIREELLHLLNTKDAMSSRIFSAGSPAGSCSSPGLDQTAGQ